MVMESVTAWVIVRRYDQLDTTPDEDVSNSPALPIHLTKDATFGDLKCQVRAWLGLSQSGSEIMKLRRSDGTLVTLSYLLEGNPEDKPYLLDIARIHQNSPASPRVAMSPTYIETIHNMLSSLQKRVEHVEALVPELRSRRLASIERTMQQLGSKVNFLDKRLDELAPLEWKSQFQQSPTSS